MRFYRLLIVVLKTLHSRQICALTAFLELCLVIPEISRQRVIDDVIPGIDVAEWNGEIIVDQKALAFLCLGDLCCLLIGKIIQTNELPQVLSRLVEQHNKLTVLQHGQCRLGRHNIGDILCDAGRQAAVFPAAGKDALKKDTGTVFVLVITVDWSRVVARPVLLVRRTM